MKKVYFDETQKERGKIDTNYSILRDTLKDQGFTVAAYDDFPIKKEGLDCDLLVFPCPDGSRLQKHEIEAVKDFVERGRGLLVISNAGGDRGLRTNMNELLNQFGIEILSNQVKDDRNNEFNMPTHPVITDIKEHPITTGVSEIVIVAGCSVRGSSNVLPLALTSASAEPPNSPVVIAGEIKKGRIVVVGSYRLFSNYGAGISLRNNRRLAMNIFRWLARKEVPTPGSAAEAPPKVEERAIEEAIKTKTEAPPTTESIPSPTASSVSQATPEPSSTPEEKEEKTVTAEPAPPSTTRASTSAAQPSSSSIAALDRKFSGELESLRAEISEMREIIARLYTDSLGYLQEMSEEVRSMLDYLRAKEGS
ncbi:MAG: hypothetical protein GF308_12000 [Candidatus Heimdallarchaeota archaeon]|nr:hypothetical protein [Candidatus Heimdallarchaeota archaeon]